MGRIRQLDETLVDQIAAGEVVERPASVVKELLENALDAGARSVTVEVERGGTVLIRVSDDGCGMDREDAPLALRRHATSKIAAFEDLRRLRTLGFRGEALPSIASVSRFALVTRRAEDAEGTRVEVEGGGEPRVRPAGRPPGTTVEVRDLFFNVPARRKFLRSVGAESAAITEVCLRTALAHPELRLVLLRDGRRVRQWLPVEGPLQRAAMLLGGKRSHLEGERAGVRVRAVLSAPEEARSGASHLHLFVNGRPVRDRALARAVAFAYGSTLPPGRYPQGVVFVDVDPAKVDVNVHPQKLEVRFEEPRLVLDTVTRLLATALGTVAWEQVSRPRAEPAASSSAPPPPPPPPAEAPDPEEGLTGAAGDPTAEALRAALRSAAQGTRAAEEPPSASPAPPPGTSVTSPHAAPPSTTAATAQQRLQGAFGRLRYVGQVRGTYLVCEADDALVVVDQHAADERIRYHRLRRAMRERGIRTQALLVPETVEVSEAEVALAEEHAERLELLGLSCDAAGPRTLRVRAVPALLHRAPPERLLRDALAELSHRGERAFGDALERALATMACHGAVRAGERLAPEQARAILEALDEVDEFAAHCPHGRPILERLPFETLARRVGR